MKYQINKARRRNSFRTLLWLLLVAILVLYSIVICGWWQKGSRNFERQRIERYDEDI